MTDDPTARPCERELRAMAYALLDEVETRANAIHRAFPDLSPKQALELALEAMARD